MEDNLLETDRKRYADDVTVQELVRLRVENERLRAMTKVNLDAFHNNVVEIERLREEVAEWKQAANAEASERRKSHDEIERLREALEKIADFDPNPSGSGPAYGQCGEMVRVARSALQQKESE